jgi:hypothetical protein
MSPNSASVELHSSYCDHIIYLLLKKIINYNIKLDIVNLAEIFSENEHSSYYYETDYFLNFSSRNEYINKLIDKIIEKIK